MVHVNIPFVGLCVCVCAHARAPTCMHALCVCVCGHLCACGWCVTWWMYVNMCSVYVFSFVYHYKAFTSNELSFVAGWQPFVRLWTCLPREDGPAACLKHQVCSVGEVPVTDGFQESFLACWPDLESATGGSLSHVPHRQLLISQVHTLCIPWPYSWRWVTCTGQVHSLCIPWPCSWRWVTCT